MAAQQNISREKAKSYIMQSLVTIDDKIVTKPAFLCELTDHPALLPSKDFVSRGGFKLEQALTGFNIDPKGKICMDFGASTGGFVQCLLEKGAAKVFAVDVSNRLDHSLKNHEAVEFIEGNIRYLDLPVVQIITIDLSFISLIHIMHKAYISLEEGGFCLALVKPQFETRIHKKGIVKSPKVRAQTVEKIKIHCKDLGFEVVNEMPCTLAGKKGNVEYFLCLNKDIHR